MIEIKYTTRVFPQKSGSVAVRVRWDHKKNEVELPTGVYVDSEKWDFTTQWKFLRKVTRLFFFERDPFLSKVTRLS